MLDGVMIQMLELKRMYTINETVLKAGGMSLMAEIQQTQVLPAPFIEAAGRNIFRTFMQKQLAVLKV
jgi:hypothetical protein